MIIKIVFARPYSTYAILQIIINTTAMCCIGIYMYGAAIPSHGEWKMPMLNQHPHIPCLVRGLYVRVSGPICFIIRTWKRRCFCHILCNHKQ